MSEPDSLPDAPPDEATALLARAEAARIHAHAPYSAFKVAAALRAASGRVYVGVNVENAAYPVGTCAEAGAIAAMVAGGDTRIAVIVVSGESPTPLTPCGACRQRIREFATAATIVYAGGPDGLRARFTLEDLLPHAFGPHNLGSATP